VAVRLDPHDEPVAEPPDEYLGPVAIVQRGRSEHDSLGPPGEQRVDLLLGADAAARLHGHPQAAHGTEDVGVPDLARAREIDVHDVEPPGARVEERRRGPQRVGPERRRRDLAGPQDVYETATGDVQRRDHLEVHGSER
jgi:hypothetical protein